MTPADKPDSPTGPGETNQPAPSPATRRTYAWVRLYETGQAQANLRPSTGLSPGRPPRTVPTRRTSVTFTTGDETAVTDWQARFTRLLGRKPSIGETMGILARVCAERLQVLDANPMPDTLAELVTILVGEPQSSPVSSE